MTPQIQRHVERDDTTRYLCAATQLDSKYADDAIREFLVEPTRPVPPSPGVNATAVLGEAIAARTRRKYRDGALAVLAIVAVFTAPGSLLIGWLVVGVLTALPLLLRQGKSLAGPGRRNQITALVVAVVAIGLLVTLAPTLLSDLFNSPSSRSSRSFDAKANSDAGLIVAILMITGMLGVLVADRLIVWRHLTTRFHRTSGPIANPLAGNRQILGASPVRFTRELRRVAAAQAVRSEQDDAPLIVYRGYSPFVGSGFEYRPWSVAVPLQRTNSKPATTTLTTDVLYESIRKALAGLGRATPLTPGRRLGRLKVSEQIIVPADELIDHLADPASRRILADLDYPPHGSLPAADVAELRANPEEWARYYLCFQVETWDRDLVLSVFVHAAMDDNTLYVEWTPCVLLPIKEEYQEIDRLRPGPIRPIMEAVTRLVRLPATIIGSTLHTLQMIRPLPRRHGTVDAQMYGSLRSLREMAADEGVRNYFQLADVDRYLKILNSRFILAVSKLLQDNGFSAASFMQQAGTVNNRHVHIGGSMTGNIVMGDESIAGDVKTNQEDK